MALTNFTDGNALSETQLDGMYGMLLGTCIAQKIETLVDRNITEPKGQAYILAEAYVDADGQRASVSTTNTTAVYDWSNLKYEPHTNLSQTGSITSTGVTNDTRAFDSSISNFVLMDDISDDVGRNFGGTYAITDVRVGCSNPAGASAFKLQSYNGSTWSDIGGTATAVSTGGTLTWFTLSINASHNGVKVVCTDTDDLRVYEIVILGTKTQTKVVEHTIPTGTFSSTISSAIANVKIADWENTATIQFKLSNGSEDTGWLDVFESTTQPLIPKVNTFTAFTLEPTKFIVQLKPKVSSPTTGYPSIYGAGVIAQ